MTKATETKLLADVGNIKQAIMGNGVKGLAQRTGELEDWRDTHPRECPMERKQGDIFKVRALEMSLMAIILTAAQIVLKLAGIL